jgi:histone-binding protein RBBP4
MNSKKEGGSASHQISVEDRYSQWKSHIPVLYDWFVNHNLVWPTQSCRWGSLLEEQTYKNRHRLYISEQTDGTVLNTLVIATVEVVKPRVAAAEHIAQVPSIQLFVIFIQIIIASFFCVCNIPILN